MGNKNPVLGKPEQKNKKVALVLEFGKKKKWVEQDESGKWVPRK